MRLDVVVPGVVPTGRLRAGTSDSLGLVKGDDQVLDTVDLSSIEDSEGGRRCTTELVGHARWCCRSGQRGVGPSGILGFTLRPLFGPPGSGLDHGDIPTEGPSRVSDLPGVDHLLSVLKVRGRPHVIDCRP